MKLNYFISTFIATILLSSNIFAASPQFSIIDTFDGHTAELYYCDYTEAYDSIGVPISNSGKQNILYIDGSVVKDIDIPIKNNRSLIPLRTISERLNYNVVWNDFSRSITITNNDNAIQLYIGDKKIYTDNETLEIDIPPEIINGLTYIPVSALGLALNVDIDYYLGLSGSNIPINFISIESKELVSSYQIDEALEKIKLNVNNCLNQLNYSGGIRTDFFDIHYINSLGRYYIFSIYKDIYNTKDKVVFFDSTNGDIYSVTGDGSGHISLVASDVMGTVATGYEEADAIDYAMNHSIYDDISSAENQSAYNNSSSSNNSVESSHLSTVYIGATGDKYHRASCSSLKGNGKAISLSDALSSGYSACKVCKP